MTVNGEYMLGWIDMEFLDRKMAKIVKPSMALKIDYKPYKISLIISLQRVIPKKHASEDL